MNDLKTDILNIDAALDRQTLDSLKLKNQSTGKLFNPQNFAVTTCKGNIERQEIKLRIIHLLFRYRQWSEGPKSLCSTKKKYQMGLIRIKFRTGHKTRYLFLIG